MTNELEECIKRKLKVYFEQLGNEKGSQVLNMVTRITESTTIKFVLDKVDNNKSEAAKILGISRSTLAKKILLYKS